MKTKILILFVLALSACANGYELKTYIQSDSYGSVFEGQSVPQDIR